VKQVIFICQTCKRWNDTRLVPGDLKPVRECKFESLTEAYQHILNEAWTGDHHMVAVATDNEAEDRE
jgi:hypothetical protein